MWYYVKFYGHVKLIANDVDALIGRAFCYLIVIATLLQFRQFSFVIHPATSMSSLTINVLTRLAAGPWLMVDSYKLQRC